MRGNLVWVASKQAVSKTLRSTLGEDVEWHKVDVARTLATGVDVTLFEVFNGPGPSHPLWDCPGLRVVIWFSNKPRFCPPSHWTLRTTRIQHTELGGVTDGDHQVQVATRDSEPRSWEWPAPVGMEANLSDVVDSTVMGWVVLEEIPSVEQSLLRMGHLKGGSGPLVLPCVRSTTGCVSRHLTTKKLANGLDLPATLVEGLPEAELKRIMQPGLVPSKIPLYVAEAILGFIDPTGEREGQKQRAQFPLGNAVVGKRAKAAEDDESIISGLTTVTPTTSRSHALIKSDAAAVPTYLWDERLGLHGEHWGPTIGLRQIQRGLEWVRGRLHAIWCWQVARSFWQWVIKGKASCLEKGIKFDKRAYAPGLAAIDYSRQSDWWEWKGGSAPFFWRWPTHCMEEIRDGLQPRFIGPPPSYRRPQRVPADKETVEKIRTKLEKFRHRGYIWRGAVNSLMSLFEVPKGLTDIHIVFDGTACGLNNVLWAPWFCLPTVNSMARVGQFLPNLRKMQ